VFVWFISQQFFSPKTNQPAVLFSPNNALFAWLISHQPAVLFSQTKPATNNQPAVLFSQNKSAPTTSQASRSAVSFKYKLINHPSFPRASLSE
jgi:hypothetical protein